jgi:hypothetical protein
MMLNFFCRPLTCSGIVYPGHPCDATPSRQLRIHTLFAVHDCVFKFEFELLNKTINIPGDFK